MYDPALLDNVLLNNEIDTKKKIDKNDNYDIIFENAVGELRYCM